MPSTPSTTPEPAAPAWTQAELANPHSNELKPDKVRSMFGSISRYYDLNNRLHSFWLDQHWRRTAVRDAGVQPADMVLDIACGTGDLTQAFAKAGAAQVTGLDFTREMLDIAVAKQNRLNPETAARVSYEWADAQDLPKADASADIVSIAFGLRNVADPAQALREFHRVLRPGGRLIILEFADPPNPVVRWGNTIYCKHVMPLTATLISGDRSGAYRYLPASVSTFLSPDKVCDQVRATGFTDVRIRRLTFGVCVCYRALRP
ncbi:MAG: bifunctional demethylmenaquinone methyltransferase/2-methoxy-6-polyprenyl-1,4-benzoquinol methylase UbiE [Phycisphaeraceae bacterium]|nr:bifunctional demethylmenaquinone methyltransferase/2-methoxy-6-polyprenyl-1,4-benzoquinol methylase UbiE [Phycisphaeraceae bacterium]